MAISQKAISDSCSERLKQENIELWKRLENHPFIIGYEKGTLSLSNMGRYLVNDHLYVVDYGKCCAIAASKAQDMETVRGFLTMAGGAIDSEFKKQGILAKEVGIPTDQIDHVKPARTYYEYTGYMYKVALTGTLGEIASVLAPCAWSYEELGPRIWKGLAANYKVSDEGLKLWEGYSLPEYRDLVTFLKGVLDRSAESASESEMRRIREHFRIALELEYDFWDIGLSTNDQ